MMDALIKGREAVDKYIALGFENKSESLPKLKSSLTRLGFDSVDAFFKYNDECNYAELKRCYIGKGECDFCHDREFSCICADKTLTYKNNLHNDCAPENSWSVPWVNFYVFQNYQGNSPENCTMYYEKLYEPDFDIYWNMQKGVTP